MRLKDHHYIATGIFILVMFLNFLNPTFPAYPMEIDAHNFVEGAMNFAHGRGFTEWRSYWGRYVYSLRPTTKTLYYISTSFLGTIFRVLNFKGVFHPMWDQVEPYFLGAIATTIIFQGLSAVVTFYLCLHLTESKWISTSMSLLALSSPSFLYYSGKPYTETLYMFFILTTTYVCFTREDEKGVLLASFLSGVTSWVRPTGFGIPPIIWVYVYFKHRNLKLLLKSVIVSLAPIWLLFVFKHMVPAPPLVTELGTYKDAWIVWIIRRLDHYDPARYFQIQKSIFNRQFMLWVREFFGWPYYPTLTIVSAIYLLIKRRTAKVGFLFYMIFVSYVSVLITFAFHYRYPQIGVPYAFIVIGLLLKDLKIDRNDLTKAGIFGVTYLCVLSNMVITEDLSHTFTSGTYGGDTSRPKLIAKAVEYIEVEILPELPVHDKPNNLNGSLPPSQSVPHKTMVVSDPVEWLHYTGYYGYVSCWDWNIDSALEASYIIFESWTTAWWGRHPFNVMREDIENGVTLIHMPLKDPIYPTIYLEYVVSWTSSQNEKIAIYRVVRCS